MYRATGLLHGVGRLDGPAATTSLLSFLQERWKGVWPILYGDQLRQARLDDWIFQGVLDVEHAPAAPPVGVAPPEVRAEAAG
jgi:glycerol-3-phosphate dehydrogenase